MTNSGSHRDRFLAKQYRRSIHRCALVIFLVAIIMLTLLLHFTVNDSLICPLVTYVLVSSYVVLVCATNSRCCSSKRIYHKPLPKLIYMPKVFHELKRFKDIQPIKTDQLEVNMTQERVTH